jgi:hypothetical protein
MKTHRTGSSKLDAIISLANEIEKSDNGKAIIATLTTDAKNFYNKTIMPVTLCLEKCCQGDKLKFCEKWGNFSYSRFHERCSKGNCDQ